MIELSAGERCFSVQGVGEQINSVSLRRDREVLRTIAQGAVDSKLGARPVGEKAQVLLRQRLQKRVTFDDSTGEPAGLKVKSTVLSCDELGRLGMGIVRGLPARVQQQGSAQQAAGAVPAGTSCTETAARQVPSPAQQCLCSNSHCCRTEGCCGRHKQWAQQSFLSSGCCCRTQGCCWAHGAQQLQCSSICCCRTGCCCRIDAEGLQQHARSCARCSRT